jgi:hypothetical protein
MANWYGTLSHFDSCPTSGSGAGACGTCFSNQGGLAYPNLSGHVPPNYAYSCTHQFSGGLPLKSCGSYLNITPDCGSATLAPIVDHGPGAACHLDPLLCHSTRVGYGYRLLDATPTTFGLLSEKCN